MPRNTFSVLQLVASLCSVEAAESSASRLQRQGAGRKKGGREKECDQLQEGANQLQEGS